MSRNDVGMEILYNIPGYAIRRCSELRPDYSRANRDVPTAFEPHSSGSRKIPTTYEFIPAEHVHEKISVEIFGIPQRLYKASMHHGIQNMK